MLETPFVLVKSQQKALVLDFRIQLWSCSTLDIISTGWWLFCSEQIEQNTKKKKSKWQFLTGNVTITEGRCCSGLVDICSIIFIFFLFRLSKNDISKDMDEKEATDVHDATVEEEEKVNFLFCFVSFFTFIPKFVFKRFHITLNSHGYVLKTHMAEMYKSSLWIAFKKPNFFWLLLSNAEKLQPQAIHFQTSRSPLLWLFSPLARVFFSCLLFFNPRVDCYSCYLGTDAAETHTHTHASSMHMYPAHIWDCFSFKTIAWLALHFYTRLASQSTSPFIPQISTPSWPLTAH